MTITKIESGKYNVTTQKLTYIVRKVMHPIRHTPIGWEILDDHVTFILYLRLFVFNLYQRSGT